MARILGALVLLVCVVYVTSQTCPPASNCHHEECCLKPNGNQDQGRCSPLLVRNSRCNEHDYKENGAYLYDCPCMDGLSCREGRCREPERYRAPTRPPPTRNDTLAVE